MLVYQSVIRPGLYQLLRLRRASTCQLHQAPSSLPTIGPNQPKSGWEVHMWLQDKDNKCTMYVMKRNPSRKNNGCFKKNTIVELGCSLIISIPWQWNQNLTRMLYFQIAFEGGTNPWSHCGSVSWQSPEPMNILQFAVTCTNWNNCSKASVLRNQHKFIYLPCKLWNHCHFGKVARCCRPHDVTYTEY